MPTPQTPEFAVVGAGLTGLALAYGLARLGRSVVLVERREQAQLLHLPSHGLIWAQGNLGRDAVARQWTNLALARWGEFDQQLCQISAASTQFERPGGAWIGVDALALQGRQLQAEAAADDPELEWLDGDTLRRLVPGLSLQVAGASYCPDDAQLNRRLLHRALLRALDNLGVEQRYLRGVEAVRPCARGYRLEGEGLSLSVGRVVLACGGQGVELAQSLGFEPLHTHLDTLWESEPVRAFLPFPLWQLRQARDGGLTVPVGDDGEASEPWRVALAAYPRLGQLRRRAWVETRTECPDGLPRYQRAPAHPGVARVVSPDSLLHCPLHASLLPAWLAGKLPDAAMAPFAGLPPSDQAATDALPGSTGAEGLGADVG